MKKEFRSEIILFVGVLLIFLLTFLINGYQIYADSDDYIAMREPRLYSVYLLFFQKAFSFAEKTVFLSAAALTQCVLSAFSIWFVSCMIKNAFRLDFLWRVMVVLMLLSPYYISAIVARSGFLIPCAITTEGLALPVSMICYGLFIGVLFKERQRVWNWILSGLFFTAVATMIREQLVFLFIGILIAGFFRLKEVKEKQLLFALCIVFCSVGFLVEQGIFTLAGNADRGNTVASHVLPTLIYISEADDAETIGDAKLKDLFLRIFDMADQEKYNLVYQRRGLLDIAGGAEESHDKLRGIIVNCLTEIGENDARYDETENQLMKAMILSHPGRWLLVYLGYLLYGFIRSVAFVQRFLNWVVLFLYTLAGTALALCMHINKESSAVRMMIITLGCIASNTVIMSLIIMPLSRYMIYNLPFFYISLFLLLRELYWTKKTEQWDESTS